MKSTYSILPSTNKAFDSHGPPMFIYAQPLCETLPVADLDISKIPKCKHCQAYFSGLCQYNTHGWNCAVCSKRNDFETPTKLSENIIKQSYKILHQPEQESPIVHAILIACGDVHPAKSIMMSLPSDIKVGIYVIVSQGSATTLITNAGNIEALNKLPKASIHADISSVIPILTNLINEKSGCVWARIFCAGGDVETIKGKINMLERVPIRTDFFVDSKITPSAVALSQILPGVCRTFDSFEKPGSLEKAADLAAEDAQREFGFQSKIVIKSGNFKATPISKLPTIPIIASCRTSVPFSLQPPQVENNLAFQVIQIVSTTHVWSPSEKTMRKVTTVINRDFPVSSDPSVVKSSRSQSISFDAQARVSIGADAIDAVSKALPGVRGSPDGFVAEFLALCDPVTWKFVLGAVRETWGREDAVVVLKRFPRVLFASSGGEPVSLGETVIRFVDACRPLKVTVERVSMEEIDAIKN